MVRLASSAQTLRALGGAREVTLLAYTLRPGRVLDALEAASRRGAHVAVRLEGQPYRDPRGALQRVNQATIDALRAAGVDARLMHAPGCGEIPLHAKALLVDRALYLDDCNWGSDARSTIVLDTSKRDIRAMRDAVAGTLEAPSRTFSDGKRGALLLEARLIGRARRGQTVDIESESLGDRNIVCDAMAGAVHRGVHVRLLIARRDTDGAAEQRALAKLTADGVQIRCCADDEKFAAAAGRAWIGSANATSAAGKADSVDWGLRTGQATIVKHLRERFASRWQNASRLA